MCTFTENSLEQNKNLNQIFKPQIIISSSRITMLNKLEMTDFKDVTCNMSTCTRNLKNPHDLAQKLRANLYMQSTYTY